MIKCVPMQLEHFECIVPDPVFTGIKACMDPSRILEHGKAMAWIRGHEVLAVGGYVQRREGVAWLWFLPAEAGARILLRVARHFKRWIATLDDGIRLEAAVLADFEAGLRWAEFVGLTRETGEPMRKWNGVNDFHLYARVTGDSDD